MTFHPARRAIVVVALVAAAAALGSGCDSIYYQAMKKLGKEKRDILVSRVKEARTSQAEAQKEFKSALERFQAIVQVEGGSLEDKYTKLNDELERSEDRANKVKGRIDAVRDVSKDLFKEWNEELIADMQRSVAEADAFIAAMEREDAGEGAAR